MKTSSQPGPFCFVLAFALTACGTEVPQVRDAVAAMPLDGTPSALAGSWRGASRIDGRPREISTGLTLGGPGNTLHYGAPLSCRLDLQDAGIPGQNHDYDITSSNGGWCDRALAGRLQVVTAPDHGVSITLLDANDATLANGTLQPVATTP